MLPVRLIILYIWYSIPLHLFSKTFTRKAFTTVGRSYLIMIFWFNHSRNSKILKLQKTKLLNFKIIKQYIKKYTSRHSTQKIHSLLQLNKHTPDVHSYNTCFILFHLTHLFPVKHFTFVHSVVIQLPSCAHVKPSYLFVRLNSWL